MQNPHHWKKQKKKKKMNKKLKWFLHQGLVCHYEGAQMEPQTIIFVISDTRTRDNLKLFVGGGAGQQRTPPE